MKEMKINMRCVGLLFMLVPILMLSCSIDTDPYNGKNDSEALNSLDGLKTATNGVYSYLKKTSIYSQFSPYGRIFK